MTFLAPGFLALFGLAIPILLFYILKLRRPEVKISSLYLWQQVIRDREANTPWQRIRRNLLLFLQLLILGLLSLAMARPGLPTASLDSGSLVILLDGSASMQAHDVAPDRFSVAKAAARRLIQNLEPDARMTLILVSHQPEIIAAEENDPVRLLAALDQTSAADTPGDWVTAAALAAGAAQNLGAQTTTVIISDGGTGDLALPPIPGALRYLPIGESGENIAVSQLAVTAGENSAQLFGQVKNYGSRQAALVASIYRDGELIDAQQMTISPGENQSLIIEGLPEAPGLYELQIEPQPDNNPSGNHLLLDDRSFYPLRLSRPNTGLLVTQGNYFIEQLLGAFDNFEFVRAIGEEDLDQLADGSYDIFVLDGLVPPSLPDGNILFINPPMNDLFQVREERSAVEQTVTIADTPLAKHLSWQDVHIRETRLIELPYWANPLVRSGDTPLVFTGETGGRRIAVISFDLLASDLPLNTAFPILMANLLDFLSPTDQIGLPARVNPGDILAQLSNPAYQETSLTSPSQEEVQIFPGLQSINNLTLSQVGLYRIKTLVDQVEYQELVAVNLQEPQESQILPVGELKIGQTTASAIPFTDTGTRELWPFLALAGFFVLLVEWWLYNQGNTDDLNWLTKPLRNTIYRIRMLTHARSGARRRRF